MNLFKRDSNNKLLNLQILTPVIWLLTASEFKLLIVSFLQNGMFDRYEPITESLCNYCCV